MIDLSEIHSLTDFQRNAKAHLKRLKRNRRPMVLTVNGKAEAVVQDAKSYQELLELIDRAEAIEGIRRGLEDVKKGRTKAARKFFDEMRREFKIAREA
ncbi:MAG: type II toxin-antitoxin system Phd/YefM family antitoxin [Candidatus Binatia bacterium]